MATTAAVPGLSQATRGLTVSRSVNGTSTSSCLVTKVDALGQSRRPSGAVSRRKSNTTFNSPLKVSAVLDKPTGKSSAGQSSNQPRDAAREALERLFAQAQRHEERREDPTYATETELESALLQIEADLSTAVGALRTKEDDLRAAEEAMKKERREIQQMRMALLQREKQLQVAGDGQAEKGEEIARLNGLVGLLSQDLDVAQSQLKSQYREVEQAKAALGAVEDELRKSQARLLERDEEVLKARILLEKTEAEWSRGLEKEGRHVSRVEHEAEVLASFIADKQLKQENLDVQKVALERTELDLEARAVALLGAQDEILSLEDELFKGRENNAATKEELARAKGLLAEVQTELQQTQSALVTFKTETQKQWDSVVKIDDAVECQKTVVRIREAELADARGEVAAMKGEVELSRSRFEKMWSQFEEQQKATGDVESKLGATKEALLTSVAEIGMLKRAVRQKDSALSDALLQIEISQAEMIGYRLELQSVKSELSRTRMQLRDKTRDMVVLRAQVVSLQMELTEVRVALREKEVEVQKLGAAVKERDETIAVLESDLSASISKLNEATTVVQSIASLSKTLAQTATGGDQPRGEGDPVLMQTSMELFAANKALLARDAQLYALQEKAATGSAERQSIEDELLRVKGALQKREVELAVMATKLGDKDMELRNVVNRWDEREEDLDQLRQEISTEAVNLAKLDQLKQAVRDAQVAEASGPRLDPLELEVAQLEAETALVALRGLATLSQELLQECRAETSSKTSAGGSGALSVAGNRLAKAASGLKEEVAAAMEMKELEALKLELHERDVALEKARNAMQGLTKLTERLIGDATLEAEG